MDADRAGQPLWEALAPPSPKAGVARSGLDADLCVIGLGGTGLSAVHTALERGAGVVGLDAGGIAAGAAGRNGGFLLAGVARFHHRVVAEHGRQRARQLYLATLDEMDRMESATPRWVRRVGSLRVAADQAELDDCAAQLEAMRADGLEVEPYDGAEGRGLLFPLDGVLQPAARARALAQQAVEAGAVLVWPATVERVAADRVRLSGGGELRCRQVLVCVDGAGLLSLVPQLAASVRTVRLQMLATAPTSEVDLARPVYCRDGLDYWQQLPSDWDDAAVGAGRRVVLGGCRDAGGDAEWGAPAEPGAPVQRALDRLLREGLGVQAPVTHRWAGVVSYSASGMPVVRRTDDGVLVAGAYNGTGNVVGPLAGRALVELALDARSDLASLLDGG